MRKLLAFLLCFLQLLLFAGKTGLKRNYREVEQLLVIQTMGLDALRGGVTLSLAAAGEADRGVARMTADGVSISAAMDRIRGYSYEEELFCPHIGQLLLGEKAAEQGVEAALAYISRSPDLRLDMPLFVVRGGTAKDAILNVGSGEKGISDVMRIVEQDVKRRGESGLTTAAQILRDTARCGSALICALNPGPAAETLDSADAQDGGKEKLSIAPLGYAILREGRLCRYLTREQGIAVSFLKNEVGLSTVEVRDRLGNNAVLELNGGGARIRPLWEGDSLRGIAVQCEARAGLLELGGRNALKGTEDADYLTAQLESQLAQWLSGALQASKDLKADYLCLAETLEQADPAAWRKLDRDFIDLLPDLELQIMVSAKLNEMKDMK
jgi:hypothetical protein